MKGYDLFNGIGAFAKAAYNTIENYETVLWSEIDKHAIQTFLKNFPHLAGKNIGDIARVVFDIDKRGRWEANEYRVSLLPDADLVLAGSPCQDLTIAKGNRQGLSGADSFLFYAFSEIVRIKKPKFFLLENVASMSNEARGEISNILECEAVEISSVYFTGQKRKRLYWFNWDLKEELPTEEQFQGRRDDLIAWSSSNDYDKVTGEWLRKRERETKDGYANTLGRGKGCAFFSSINKIVMPDGSHRLMTPEECEVYQGLPIGWTEGVTEAQRYKQIGNAVTVPVIEHILRSLPHA